MSEHVLAIYPQAMRDIVGILDRYLAEHGTLTVRRFHQTLIKAFRVLTFMPSIGSPRRSALMSIPGLRLWPLQRYPHLLYYLDHKAFPLLLRVMHERSETRRRHLLS